MQAKSGRVFDGSAHLKNILTNSSGEEIASVESFFLRMLEITSGG